MRKVIALTIAVVGYFGMLLAKPMEALNRYNVILVHGAAPEEKGFESDCMAANMHDAYTIAFNNITKLDSSVSSQLGGAVGVLGAYDRTFNPNENSDYNERSAKKLTYWLDSAVFEDYQYRNGKIYMDSVNLRSSPYIYIQRSFANPAESPAYKAHEIGDRTWKGNNKCSVRRSLFEEAQEVKASWYDVKKDSTYIGQFALEIIRQNPDLYRQIPSRYILIGHSMGGVVAREWIQNSDYYHD